MTATCSNCNGRCCAVLLLGQQITDIGAAVPDGEYIADMAVPLTLAEAADRAARFGAPCRVVPEHDGCYAMCRHWNEGTGLCMAYEQRPGICRDFPGAARPGGCRPGVPVGAAA